MYKEGGSYEGELKDGKPHGKGILLSRLGRESGEFVDGSLVNGIIQYVDGERYEGTLEKGMKVGQGKYVFKNGDIYEGTFVNNKF